MNIDQQYKVKQRIIELVHKGVITDTTDIYLKGGLVAEVSIAWDDIDPILVDIVTWGEYQSYCQLDRDEVAYFKKTNTLDYWEALDY